MIDTILKILDKGRTLVVRAIGIKPGPDIRPLSLPHVYYSAFAPDLSTPSKPRFTYICTYCGRNDPEERRYTSPPCDRNGPPKPKN